jgi:hypothetical protein
MPRTVVVRTTVANVKHLAMTFLPFDFTAVGIAETASVCLLQHATS